VLPDEDKYFLWSAISDKSIFKFPSVKGKDTESSDQWSDIWKFLKPSRKAKKCLRTLKSPLITLNGELQSAVKSLLEAENRLLSVSKSISKAVEEKFLTQLKPKKVQNVLKWVDKVLS